MVDHSSNGETTYRLFCIAGPNTTNVLEASRQIACVLLRRARCGGRQAGSSHARNRTDCSGSWKRRTACRSMERTADDCAKIWRSCTLADLPRELELTPSIPGPREPPNDEETTFIVVHMSSDATNPIGADDKTCPKQRSHDGVDTRPGAGAATLGRRSGDMSRVLRVNLPLGRHAQHVFEHRVLLRGPVRSRSQVNTSASGGKSVLREEMRVLAWR